ncbi:hypothetical protein HPB52_008531 [Rhipicephalus sanguineus]|uniref:Uncharacterized protein n=1 Tax=Rhipicephalus sanguineus TaxID=34632 RepID=A0A9D4T796_RHISA|nr:hypothetical protein HPB52_008531 [Rhipicephalus sanguineus]
MTLMHTHFCTAARAGQCEGRAYETSSKIGTVHRGSRDQRQLKPVRQHVNDQTSTAREWPSKPFEPRNVQHVANSGRCSFRVWGAPSKEGLGPLVRLRGKFNAEAYYDLIESVVVPYALHAPFPNGLYFFQQDRSPIHMEKSTTLVLEELGMMLLDWPPQGADMNIIENVWAP